MERAPGLGAVEIHQGSSLTESIELVSEKTSQKVASTSSAILAHWSSCLVVILVCQSLYFLANPSHPWANSHLSWALAQVMLCSHIRAGLGLGPSLVCELSSWWREKGDGGIDSSMDLTGSAPSPQSFPTTLPGGWDRPLAPPLPLHMARQLVLGNKGAAAKGTVDLKWIGWLNIQWKSSYIQVKEAGGPPSEVKWAGKYFHNHYGWFGRVSLV